MLRIVVKLSFMVGVARPVLFKRLGSRYQLIYSPAVVYPPVSQNSQAQSLLKNRFGAALHSALHFSNEVTTDIASVHWRGM